MSEERRNELLNIFIKAFCKYGIDGTTTKKLAAEANLSEAGLYVYFKNKEDILLKCFEYHIQNLMKVTNEFIDKYGSQPDKFVWAMFEYVKSLILENRFVFQVMLHPYYSQLTLDLRKSMLDSIQIESKALKSYSLSDENANAVILLLNSALNNYIFTHDEAQFRIQVEFLLSTLSDVSDR